MRLWKGVGGGDGRLKRTRPLEPERWVGGRGRTAHSIRTRVHRRAKVARAKKYSIYFLTNVNGTNNTLVPQRIVRYSYNLAYEIYTWISL